MDASSPTEVASSSSVDDNVAAEGSPQNASKISEENQEDDKCVICDDGTVYIGDDIVYCDKCLIPVHQKCYGIEVVPKGDWYCDVCLCGKRPKDVICELCHERDGAFQRTIDDEYRWVHTRCGLSFSEICECDEQQNSRSAFNLSKLHPDYERIKLRCILCKEKDERLCIQCSVGRCTVAGHLRCVAKDRSGLTTCVEMMNSSGAAYWGMVCKTHKEALQKKDENTPKKQTSKPTKRLPAASAAAGGSGASLKENKYKEVLQGFSEKNVITANSIYSHRMRLSWTRADRTIDSSITYLIEQKDPTDLTWVHAEKKGEFHLGGVTASITVENLLPDTEYFFRACAMDEDGNSSDWIYTRGTIRTKTKTVPSSPSITPASTLSPRGATAAGAHHTGYDDDEEKDEVDNDVDNDDNDVDNDDKSDNDDDEKRSSNGSLMDDGAETTSEMWDGLLLLDKELPLYSGDDEDDLFGLHQQHDHSEQKLSSNTQNAKMKKMPMVQSSFEGANSREHEKKKAPSPISSQNAAAHTAAPLGGSSDSAFKKKRTTAGMVSLKYNKRVSRGGSVSASASAATSSVESLSPNMTKKATSKEKKAGGKSATGTGTGSKERGAKSAAVGAVRATTGAGASEKSKKKKTKATKRAREESDDDNREDEDEEDSSEGEDDDDSLRGAKFKHKKRKTPIPSGTEKNKESRQSGEERRKAPKLSGGEEKKRRKSIQADDTVSDDEDDARAKKDKKGGKSVAEKPLLPARKFATDNNNNNSSNSSSSSISTVATKKDHLLQNDRDSGGGDRKDTIEVVSRSSGYTSTLSHTSGRASYANANQPSLGAGASAGAAAAIGATSSGKNAGPASGSNTSRAPLNAHHHVAHTTSAGASSGPGLCRHCRREPADVVYVPCGCRCVCTSCSVSRLPENRGVHDLRNCLYCGGIVEDAVVVFNKSTQSDECSIKWENICTGKKAVMFLPCRCFSACEACADMLNKCPNHNPPMKIDDTLLVRSFAD